MGLSDSRPMPAHGYLFPPAVGRVATPAPPGIPVSSTNLSLCAVPNHPEKPSGVLLPLFHHWWQASPSLAGWPSFNLRHEAESGSLSLRLTGSPLTGSPPEASPSGLLHSTLVRLHVERVIHIVDSFHSTRFASLLTHPRRKATQRKHRGFFSCAICGTFSGEAAARPSGENLLLSAPSPMTFYRQVYSVDCLALIFGNWPLVCTLPGHEKPIQRFGKDTASRNTADGRRSFRPRAG